MPIIDKKGWPAANRLYYYPGLTATPSKRRGMVLWPVQATVKDNIRLNFLDSPLHRFSFRHSFTGR